MPSVSRKQQKLMHGIASGSIPAGKGKPSRKVAQEFARADSARGSKKLPTRVSGGSSQGGGSMPSTTMPSTSAMGAALPPARKSGGY